MGKVLPEISEKEASFIASQQIFFVATAPLNASHHVSVSPKAGQGSAVVLDSHRIAYADLTGSGAETAAHVLENGRMTLLFCNFDKAVPPKILRLHGQAQVILAEDAPKQVLDRFPVKIVQSCGFRAIYILNVTRVSQSCGYSLPIFEFVQQRTTLDQITEKDGPQGIFDYQTAKNSFSIDCLPSLALLRKNAPKNVFPLEEDGYFVGKVSEDSGDRDRAVTDMQEKQQRQRGSSAIQVKFESLFLCLLCKPVEIQMTVPAIVALGLLLVAIGYGIGSNRCG